MKNAIALAALIVAVPASAQLVEVPQKPGVVSGALPRTEVPTAAAAAVAAQPVRRAVTLPVNTLVEVTPAGAITSKKMKEGTTRDFLTVKDIEQGGVVIIPRGSPVTAEVTWRTGKGIVGKSAKFELTFKTVRVNGVDHAMRGVHKQEGRGNTVAALLGSAIITGKSAEMAPGQIVNIFTAEPIIAQAF